MTHAEVCVIGSLNLDLVAQVQALPQSGETILASGVSRHPGGKGLNQAVAAARAGTRVRMVGRIGADAPGKQLLDYLVAAGVDVGCVERDPADSTGLALITVSQAGENCIVVAAGANMNLSTPPLEAVAGARVLLAQLETGFEPVAKLFATAPAGCLKVLNAAPALPEGAALFGLCDLLVLNETELAAHARLATLPDDLDAVAQAARTLLSRSDQSAVVTLGASGALVVEANGWLKVAGLPARAIDTVGAGDCFCGVLAASLSEGLDLAAAARRANAAAAIAVTRRGAAEGMPTREEIASAMSSLATGEASNRPR